MKTHNLKAKTGLLLLFAALLTGIFALPAAAQGKKVSIGTGSGELNYPNAQTTLNLKDGDTLVINAGVYQGITLNNITASPGKKIYVTNNGLVEITNSWVGFNTSYLTNVEISGTGTPGITYGFYIHDLVIRGMNILGRLSGVTFNYFRFENIGDYGVYMFDNSLVYDGTNNTLFYDLKFLNFKFYNITQTPFQFGDWSLVKDVGAVGMVRKVEIAYCNIENVPGNAEIIHLNRVVNANVHHNRIVHTGANDKRHAGIVFLRGNGDVHHNYISDHWGNGVRGEGFGLDSIGTINVYNNVVVNSRKYSGVECNSYDNDVYGSPYTRYCNYNVFNNTFGNLSAADWQAAMVDTYDAKGGSIVIKNNIGFNIQMDKPYDPTRNYIYSQFNVTNPDTSNNLFNQSYIPLGLVNDSSCLLNINSPAIDKGQNFNWITDDIDGVPRPQNGIFDIGAHEYQSGVVYPVANAGNNINLVLPTDSVKLDGTASYNPGGGTLKYSWLVLSGTPYTWSGDTTATPTLKGLSPGVYQVKLVVTNSTGKTNETTITVTVNAAPPPPVANAGGDITITLPVNSTLLNGNASSNPIGGTITYSWVQVAGPGTAAISNGNTATPTAGSLLEGSYQIELTVTNAQGLTAKDTVVITVNPAPPPGSQPPVANAGTDIIITLPTNTVSLDGSASYEPGGGAITYAWSIASGPAGANVVGSSSDKPMLSNLVPGTYLVNLTVTNITGLTNSDLVEVTVNAQPSPVAVAGNNVVITLPVNTATLDGSGSSQPGGGTLSYSWVVTSGPSSPAVTGTNTATPTLSGLTQGVYQLTLTVTNASGGTASSNITVTVNPVVSPNPVAEAGGSLNLILPTNSTTLNGSGSYNPAGGSLTYSWLKILGPGSFAINGANTATPIISGLAKGVYQIALTVTNAQGLSASDIINVTVSQGAVPVAITSADTTVNFPKGFALLSGVKSYALGNASIASYSWTEISGPTIALFGNDTMPNTSAGNLEPGQYIFQLTVTDDKGLSGSARVKVTVVNTFRYDKMISLYPNPCTTQINVHIISESTGPLMVRITSAGGVIVYTQAFQKNQLQFDQLIPTSQLPSGMYVVEIISGSQVQLLQKFVKQ